MAYEHCKAAEEYARRVLSGEIVAGVWIKLACERYLDDLSKQEDDEFPYYMDNDAAEHACEFIELMPHTKGRWAREGLKLALQPWQCMFVVNVFGWKRKKDGFRRFRRAELFVPRKNGKSALAAAIGNYMFVADDEFGAEVYSGATTEKQAWEVFRPAKLMVERTPEMREAYDISVNAKNMHVNADLSRFEPMIGNPGDGSSPHCAIVDEYHEHDSDAMVDTMETGMGAREQPLLLVITTAGENIAGPCYAMQVMAQKMLQGKMDDPETFAMIYGIDKDDDWTDIEIMKKANPNFGISVNEDFLAAQLSRAVANPRKQSTFKTKHLNVWVGAKDAYYDVRKYDARGDKSLTLEQFHGRKAYLGMDLASKIDIASLVVLTYDDIGNKVFFSKNYLPEDRVAEVEHYQGWEKEGLLITTDGEIIDYAEIKSDILELCQNFEVQELAYDPFQATMLVTELMQEGVPVVEMRPTVLNFSEPMKELDALIRSGRISHNGDPVFSWMISNVTGKEDKKDNVYPNKELPENKIDGPIALLMALGRAMEEETNGVAEAIQNPLSVRVGR